MGAFKGQWSRDMRQVFPDVNILMVEPLPDMQPCLELLAKQIGAETACQLLSEKAGEQVVFYVGSCGSSMHRPKRFSDSVTLTLATSCLDDLVAGSSFSTPDIVKLDVQGAEDCVMRGGERTLHGAEVLIIELSLVIRAS
ncbi:FkbM family methyltransferase [Cyanobium sp. BSA11S]|uniref:FkbM family methyltransferase n=1 Tax=Cyanobium sp. BSA11S TaxID=3108224 RepID=UPI003D8151E4